MGAGRAGFPTAVKLRTHVPLFIVNAAECEPLLHKDKELLHHFAAPMLQGLRLAMQEVGAREAVIGIKEKYKDVMAALEPQLAPLHGAVRPGSRGRSKRAHGAEG